MTKNQYIKLLKSIVNIPSKSESKHQVNKVNNILAQVLHSLDFSIIRHPHENRGDLVVARYWKLKGAKKVLFSGHADIVALKHFNAFKLKDDKAYGSGIADMKAGIIVMLGAVERIIANKIPVNLTIVLTPDEEQASHAHRLRADKIFKQHDYAFVFETGREKHAGSWRKEQIIVVERKGVAWIKIKTRGTGGHAGNNTSNRDNAIEEIAHKIVAARGLLNIKKGILVNSGTIKGGEAPNVIARYSKVTIDVRTSTRKQQQDIILKLRQIARKNIYGTTSEFDVIFTMPPLQRNPQTRNFLKIANTVCRKMNITCIEEKRGGGSDANYISGCNVPVLDGFGAVAVNFDKIHTPHEGIYVDSIFQNMEFVQKIVKQLVSQ